jgi:hypothetical protein
VALPSLSAVARSLEEPRLVTRQVHFGFCLPRALDCNMSAPSPDDIVIVDAIRTPITRAKVCALLHKKSPCCVLKARYTGVVVVGTLLCKPQQHLLRI